MERERRDVSRRFCSPKTAPSIVKRAVEGGGEREVIFGYGAVYYREGDPGTEYWLWDDIVERIRPGAFNDAVREDDVLGTLNHDYDGILGRSANQTVRLSVDAVGLLYEIDPPDTQRGRDARVLLDRGDIRGSSFGFWTGSFAKRSKVVWEESKTDAGSVWIRWIENLELVDVGPVAMPAYGGTSSGVRQGGEKSEISRLMAERDQALGRVDSRADFRRFVEISSLGLDA